MSRSAELTPTVENYLKHLFHQQQQSPDGWLPTGRLAACVGVTPGTATTMVKTLAEAGLVDYEPRGGVRLTSAGERHALGVIRRHRLIELFLVRELDLDWSEVHDEAERLEHALSDKVLERIDRLLGYPQFDPHGDPIPRAGGHVPTTEYQSLAECALHRAFVVARVTAQDAVFLQMIQRLHLVPGTRVVVEARDTAAQTVTVRPRSRPALNLGLPAAAKILVTAPG
ncbi:MAG: metal-dependent transcriptional regulator [Verrucomicrobiae bacterium]|nr:metal-dependent transcriptional regulator [Verrucomicrobiae bacterium]MDW8345062.1 metal-dependent transcriptional regulator [Verrucomicrobiae bacterium]